MPQRSRYHVGNNLKVMMRMTVHPLKRLQLIVVMRQQTAEMGVAGIVIIGEGEAEFTVYPLFIRSMPFSGSHNFNHNYAPPEM
ncbi:hypothetical protein D3C71_2059080 [compost metagenome]